MFGSIADSIAICSSKLLYRIDAKLASNVPKILNCLILIVFCLYPITGLKHSLTLFLVFPDISYQYIFAKYTNELIFVG
jgi:hypothetical protein